MITPHVNHPLPPADSLSERQLRGADCVFCHADLSHGDVTDLGQQRVLAHGSRVSWFPRACPTCPAKTGCTS